MAATLKLISHKLCPYVQRAVIALTEKGVPFEEKVVYTGAGEKYRPDYLDSSPLGKVPTLQTDEGFITESRCIIDYIERAYPQQPLYPSSPFAIGKLNELTQIVDLYLELAVRRVLPNFFARKPPPENIARDVRAAPSLRDKLGYVFGPPGWRPAATSERLPAPLEA